MFKDVPICFLYFLKNVALVRRYAGPDFDKISEVPEIIQKNSAIGLGTLISHVGIIESP